jgi:hypothetical protein
MKIKILIGILVLIIGQSKAQIIHKVDYPYQADVKIYYVDYAYQADAQVCFVDYQYQITKPGLWWIGNQYSADRLNIYEVQYSYQADLKVYIVKYPYQVKVNDKYIKLTTNPE